MTICRFVAADQPRILPGRHEPDCEGDCDGCQPCLEGHCWLDGKTHLDVVHPRTCPECVGAVRDDMIEIRDLCTHLRERAFSGSDGNGRRFAAMRLPGGDPLVLVSPVSEASADVLLRWSRICEEHPSGCPVEAHEPVDETAHGHLQSLNLTSDPEPPALTLGTWEDDWRKLLSHEAGPRFDYARSIDYLLGQLTWAGQRHDAFDEFARDMRRIRRRLEEALVDGERTEATRVPCTNCGARLVKVYGRWESDDNHACPRCRREYDDHEFARAKTLAARSEGSDTWILLADAARSIDRSIHTVRTWVNTGRVEADREFIEGAGGVMTRVYVWWPDVRHADTESSRRVRSA